MFAKLSIVLAVAAVALCAEYPPGVHPALCPNYPYCDMSLMARYTMDGLPIPEWVYNPYIMPAAPMAPAAPIMIDKPAELVDTLKYPAAFDPALCPNYPYCDTALLSRYSIDGRIPEYYPLTLPMAPLPPVVASVAVPEPAGPVSIIKAAEPTPAPAAKYPADFDESLCPNYPYCE